MSTPKISIIIPVYNQAHTIDRCLQSIMAQIFTDFEVIVVNDGSTDGVLDVLRPWEGKITVFNQENRGAPAARNFGFSQSQGQYVLFCDADIVLMPEAILKMYQALQTNFVVGYAYSSFKFGWKKFRLWPFDRERLRKMPYIHTTSLIRRECFPGFDENIKKFQDWDLWLTMLEKGYGGIWIDEILFHIVANGTMSKWLPKIFYKLPGFRISEVQKYRRAKRKIFKKHGIKYTKVNLE